MVAMLKAAEMGVVVITLGAWRLGVKRIQIRRYAALSMTNFQCIASRNLVTRAEEPQNPFGLRQYLIPGAQS